MPDEPNFEQRVAENVTEWQRQIDAGDRPAWLDDSPEEIVERCAKHVTTPRGAASPMLAAQAVAMLDVWRANRAQED
jgi:hypothetical protein